MPQNILIIKCSPANLRYCLMLSKSKLELCKICPFAFTVSVGAEDLNCTPHTWMANALPTKPPPTCRCKEGRVSVLGSMPKPELRNDLDSTKALNVL